MQTGSSSALGQGRRDVLTGRDRRAAIGRRSFAGSLLRRSSACGWASFDDVNHPPGAPAPYSFLSRLECSRTGDSYDADQVQGVSKVGAPLVNWALN
jgi:hypothetical protein